MSVFEGKKLLVLGANPETASLVLKANGMGIRTIVTDYDPNAFTKPFAWRSLDVDASDVDELERVARGLTVDGVCVGVAEALLPAYCDLCSRLGLPAFSESSVFETMTKKDLFKRLCRQHSVPVPEEWDESSVPVEAYPVIVKPSDACSSRGIGICRSPADLAFAVDRAKRSSRAGRVIVERLLTGQEIVMYYAAQAGRAFPVAMCDRYTWRRTPSSVQLPTAYIFPSVHLGQAIRETDLSVREMMKGAGIRNGTLFLQGFACDDGGVRFYEPGFRLNGAQEHMVVGPLTGVDAKEIYIRYALTGRVSDDDLETKADPYFGGKYACKLSPIARTGAVERIEGLDEISRLKGVVSVNPSYRDGDVIEGEDTLKQVACRVFIIADTVAELAKTIDVAQGLLRVIGRDGEDMVVGRFDTSELKGRM